MPKSIIDSWLFYSITEKQWVRYEYERIEAVFILVESYIA